MSASPRKGLSSEGLGRGGVMEMCICDPFIQNVQPALMPYSLHKEECPVHDPFTCYICMELRITGSIDRAGNSGDN